MLHVKSNDPKFPSGVARDFTGARILDPGLRMEGCCDDAGKIAKSVAYIFLALATLTLLIASGAFVDGSCALKLYTQICTFTAIAALLSLLTAIAVDHTRNAGRLAPFLCVMVAVCAVGLVHLYGPLNPSVPPIVNWSAVGLGFLIGFYLIIKEAKEERPPIAD